MGILGMGGGAWPYSRAFDSFDSEDNDDDGD